MAVFTALSRIIASSAAAASLIAAAPAHAAVPPPFTCQYIVLSQWHGGFNADLRITNRGPAIDGWTAHWTFQVPTRNVGVWSAQLVQANPYDAVATPASWIKKIQSGQTVAFGWTALAPSTDVPTDITINGLPC